MKTNMEQNIKANKLILILILMYNWYINIQYININM